MQRFLAQRLKFRQLRAVDAVATHGSLQRAAVALGLTQPALTKILREVETMLGVRLFDRHTRGTEVNEAGAVVVAAARRMLAEAQRLEEELDRLGQAGAESLVVGALPVAAAGILPAALAVLHERHPGMAVRLVQGVTDVLLPALAAGAVDLVVGRLYEPALPDGFLREALYEEPISVLARTDHPLFGRGRLRPRDVAAYPLVLPTISQRVGQEIERAMAALGIAGAAPPLRTSSTAVIREMLLTGDALTVIPQHVLAGDIARGAIAVVPLAVAAPARPAGVIRVAERPLTPAARTFIACLRTAIGSLGHSNRLSRRPRRE